MQKRGGKLRRERKMWTKDERGHERRTSGEDEEEQRETLME